VNAYRELRIQLWPECTDDCDREISEILTDPVRWAVFVASLENQQMVGFLEIRLRDCAEGASSSPVAFIEGWFVLPEHRRQGLGKALVQAAENWAASRGCIEIASDTQIDNRVSIAAHERLGYKQVEQLVCFLKRLKR
jgi:aminoglycoside 6'-N-acetyltransferase I